jgi:hypothetical protein
MVDRDHLLHCQTVSKINIHVKAQLYVAGEQEGNRNSEPCCSSITSHFINKKVKFTLEQAMKAQRGSRGIALLFL